jgi:hypothetical protein
MGKEEQAKIKSGFNFVVVRVRENSENTFEEVDREFRDQLRNSLLRVSECIQIIELRGEKDSIGILKEKSPLNIGVFARFGLYMLQIKLKLNLNDFSKSNLVNANNALGLILNTEGNLINYFSINKK